MADTGKKRSFLCFAALLVTGFLGLCLPNLLQLSWGYGLFTAIWILSFLLLTDLFRSRRAAWITFAVFLAGYFLRLFGSIGFEWLYVLVFLLMGLVQFGIFYGYSRLAGKWNSLLCTLAFPVLWIAVYLLAMLARFPSLIRVDMMFADMNVLLQAESVIGSSGLGFALLWILALLAYAIRKRRHTPAILSALLYLALLTIGVIYLYPGISESESVRVALATGPYVGDYLNYTSLPVEEHLASMQRCAADAAAQGAEILVFNEETYEIDDTEEEAFLTECCRAAQENAIHMLVGLDITDTDGSEGGQSLNKVVWIDQSGEILGSYLKTKTIPVLEADYARGSGEIPCHTIQVGGKELRVSYVICYDSNFPLYVDQMDDATDILFLPSWDWAAVTAQHAMLCRTLAVENRVSIVKPTYDGINLAVRPDGSVIGSFNVNDTGYEQVQLMDIPIHEESAVAPGTSDKEHYVYSIISVELLSILVCLVLLYGSLFENREKSPRNRLYTFTVALCILALGADALSWILDGCVRLEPVLYASTEISLFMTFVLNGVFIFYITEYVREKQPVSTVIPKIYMVFCVAATALILATSRTGLIFSFENGVYKEGPLYGTYIIVNLICSAFCLLTNLLHMKSLSRHDRIGTMSYIVIPWIAACINLYDETFSYAYPAIVLSMLVLYVMIQSERQDRLAKGGAVSYQNARHDALTGLPNRLAYEERLKALAAAEGTAGVLFTDVNGLKRTNDSYGHDAGDRLLIRYAEFICRFFRKEDVFRISGDEFTVLLGDISEQMLRSRAEEFRRALNEESIPLACVGLACGSSAEIGELIKVAEAEMYSDKTAFYDAHPELQRR